MMTDRHASKISYAINASLIIYNTQVIHTVSISYLWLFVLWEMVLRQGVVQFVSLQKKAMTIEVIKQFFKA